LQVAVDNPGGNLPLGLTSLGSFPFLSTRIGLEQRRHTGIDGPLPLWIRISFPSTHSDRLSCIIAFLMFCDIRFSRGDPLRKTLAHVPCKLSWFPLVIPTIDTAYDR